MLKEAIEKIEAMAQPIIQEVEGRTVAITPQDAFEIRPEPDRPDTLPLTSLDALVKLPVSATAMNTLSLKSSSM